MYLVSPHSDFYALISHSVSSWQVSALRQTRPRWLRSFVIFPRSSLYQCLSLPGWESS